MSRKHDQLDKSSKRKRGPSDNWAERYLGVTPRKHNRLRPFRWSAPSGDLSDSPSYHPSRTPVNPMSTDNCTTAQRKKRAVSYGEILRDPPGAAVSMGVAL